MSVSPSGFNPGLLPLDYSLVTYAAGGVIAAQGPAALMSFSGFNSKAAAQWIQIFDSPTVPADTAVPKLIIYAAATGNFSWSSAGLGKVFTTGISWSNSSTGPTKTVGSADCTLEAQYKI